MKLRYKIAGGFSLLVLVSLAALGVLVSRNAPCEPVAAPSASALTMQAITYHCYGGPEVLQLETVVKPIPADDEVLVKVQAAGVNPLDWHYLRGTPYILRLGSGLGTPEETRLGVDFAGTVEAIGSAVTQFKVGDAVFGGRTGAFGQYVTIGEHRALAHKPPNVTFEQAGTVSIAAVTALQALRDKGQLKAGQKVLINGASGGVGTFAVQIAKSMGAEVTGVCSTRNLELVRSLGADHVVDYKHQDFTELGQRYDLIIDNVGNHGLLKVRKALAPGGRFVIVGGPKGNWLTPLMGPIKALILSPFLDQEFVMLLAELRQDDLILLAELMGDGKVNPAIDQVFTLDQVPEAIAYSESGRARGKIVISVD